MRVYRVHGTYFDSLDEALESAKSHLLNGDDTLIVVATMSLKAFEQLPEAADLPTQSGATP